MNRMAHNNGAGTEDPYLGLGPDEDASEVYGYDSDSGSVISDDSILPAYVWEGHGTGPCVTLYESCARNEAVTVRRVLQRGVTQEEAMELDVNGRNGLILAAYMGFVDIVTELHNCPLLDVNHQDNDGNTALMIASQAGFTRIVNYILNYFSGVDLELRDSRGFTALIKAVMQGRDDCVAALVMAGANVSAVDTVTGKTPEDWALRTGHFETFQKLRSLAARPCAEQFWDRYVPEWPDLKKLVSQATAAKSKWERFIMCLWTTFTFSFPKDAQEDGVLDHMVRMTTSVHSPLVVTGCRPLCPSSPPEAGKRRLAVPELVWLYSAKELEERPVSHSHGLSSTERPSNSSDSSISLASSTSTYAHCSDTRRQGSTLSVISGRVCGYIPGSLRGHNSILPASCVPRIKVTKSRDPTPKMEKKRKMCKGCLEPPIWKYKEAAIKAEKETGNNAKRQTSRWQENSDRSKNQ